MARQLIYQLKLQLNDLRKHSRQEGQVIWEGLIVVSTMAAFLLMLSAFYSSEHSGGLHKYQFSSGQERSASSNQLSGGSSGHFSKSFSDKLSDHVSKRFSKQNKTHSPHFSSNDR